MCNNLSLQIVKISLKTANAFVEELHRHHFKVQGNKFSVGVMNKDKLVGVCIVGRPVSRYLDDGSTLEVTRLCTDGTYNACSILYARAAKIAKDMGYSKIITYILQSESGTSLKASGWICEGEAGGGNWNCQSRPRELIPNQMTLFPQKEKYPTEKKVRWSKILS